MAGGCVGQSGVAGICVRLLFVWCLGALVPCVVSSLYYTKAYRCDDQGCNIPIKISVSFNGFSGCKHSVPLDALRSKKTRKEIPWSMWGECPDGSRDTEHGTNRSH